MPLAVVQVSTTPAPDFSAVAQAPAFGHVVGALVTYGLVTAVLMVVFCATTWVIASAGGSWHLASKARAGLLVALLGSILTGAALGWGNWLLDLGASL
ncbi:hypothetical protein KVF89_25490 [Nocardioides carbamazepini]|uniref:DUF6112 family protein n=1 Tax=Nocardioides carbamazepini TaxID=2854259 RepID=UPI002149C38F|nr:DUF6112 family protein [Nocardioides carbamazepini]MCR1785914.1 hypothetical protein [Nocardioides carbamazepini]